MVPRHSVEPLHRNSLKDIELILVLREDKYSHEKKYFLIWFNMKLKKLFEVEKNDLYIVILAVFNRGIEKSSLWKRARSFKGKHTTPSSFSHM